MIQKLTRAEGISCTRDNRYKAQRFKIERFKERKDTCGWHVGNKRKCDENASGAGSLL